MADLNNLSRQALAAAMKDGTDEWGRVGSSTDHVRYKEPLPKRRGRYRGCHCGCSGRCTHRGAANGVTLVTACELGITRWVKTGRTKAAASRTPTTGAAE